VNARNLRFLPFITGLAILGQVRLAPATAAPAAPTPSSQEPRLRLLIETDAGGDPDDEQSLVRFLLYANEWDLEGIIANREKVRDGENLNRERTGLGVVRQLIEAYGQCHSNLVQNDPRYPTAASLQARTVPGYNDRDDAVNFIMAVVDRPDPRPLWYSDWGTDSGGATNNLRRALDRVWRERGPEGYARFKSRLRLTSYDVFGPHSTNRPPPFSILVNTFQPPLNGKRWYHRFSALTSKAGGFDLARDVLTGHGPLGALYPTNTTHWAKEGDSPTFIYLLPNGLNAPDQPGWGGWAGRYGRNTNYPGAQVYWANQFDAWEGSTNRDNTLARWSADLQNDFRARLDWCVRPFAQANHPPVARVAGSLNRRVSPGESVVLDARSSRDPDNQALRFRWLHYPEPSGAENENVLVPIQNVDTPIATVSVPPGQHPQPWHIILVVTDTGTPPLTRYQRILLETSSAPGASP
jgi:hypothetical protein